MLVWFRYRQPKEKMNFKFYLELATRVQDERLLNLLRIPESGSVGTGIWRARWWSRGKTTRMRSADREKILGRVWQERINELDLKWQPENSSTNNLPIRLVDLWNSFTPERTSVLWAPVPTEKLSSRDDERKRINFGGGKPPLDEEYKRSRPSTLECFLEFESEGDALNDGGLQNRVIDWLRRALQGLCEPLDCFGYGCVHGTCRKMSMVTSMGGVAAWTDQLGEKFENIYPILIGPVASCEGLLAMLGDRGSLIRISQKAPSAIVSIPHERVEEIRRDPTVREWVVMRDLSKIDAPAATLDVIYQRRLALPWEAPFVKR
jgi:hypothetical protein